jgi:hypothetical protein
LGHRTGALSNENLELVVIKIVLIGFDFQQETCFAVAATCSQSPFNFFNIVSNVSEEATAVFGGKGGKVFGI